ncbi:hypothetical protein [Helicobacter cetorum]|nr:hypothetical protein [Helicobacter cetorum]
MFGLVHYKDGSHAYTQYDPIKKITWAVCDKSSNGHTDGYTW